MAVGPVDVVIIGFPGNRFTGEVAPALLDLVDSGTIRVVDLLFVSKDTDGTLTTLLATDLQADPSVGAVHLEVVHPGALDAGDAEEVADDLPAGSSALLVAFENLWAGRFVAACRDAGGVLVDQIRIPVDVADVVLGAGPARDTVLT